MRYYQLKVYSNVETVLCTGLYTVLSICMVFLLIVSQSRVVTVYSVSSAATSLYSILYE